LIAFDPSPGRNTCPPCASEALSDGGRHAILLNRDEEVTVHHEGTACVVSIAGLIALKRLRGSPLDLLDIEALQALINQHPDAFPGSDNACP
jgi:hypothetical protein